MTSTLGPSNIWAKSPMVPGKAGESLEQHTWASLEVLAEIATRFSPETDAGGVEGVPREPDRFWHRMVWSVWLHDLGKASRAFQHYLRGERARWEHRHEVASLAFVPWVAPVGTDDHAWICATIASHHKEADKLFGLQGGYDPALGVANLDLDGLSDEFPDDTLSYLRDWVVERSPLWRSRLLEKGLRADAPYVRTGECFRPERFRAEMPSFVLAGLKAYRRTWSQLHLRQARDPDVREAICLRGLMMLADHGGSAHVPPRRDVDWTAAVRTMAETVDGPWRDHQREAASTYGDAVLCAPTGSGKTEAALLWANAQRAEPGGVSGRLLYLLPFQASLDAMRQRLAQGLSAEVGLRHGRAQASLYREYLERDEVCGDATTRAAAEAHRAVDLARLHHPAVVAATPYQLLPMALRTRGYEADWTALRNARVVMDEVHAYDPNRLGPMLAVLDHMRRHWGARVLTMSATLPSWLRPFLPGADIPVSADVFRSFRRHRLLMEDGTLLDAVRAEDSDIVGRVRTGERILVSVNTVRGAVETAETLATRGVPVLVLHSRFTGEDRLRKEAAIRSRLEETSRAGGFAVVATQVIEVSLNLDFDGLYTDPAPLEALIQRFGRLNRSGRLGVVPGVVFRQPVRSGVYDSALVEAGIAVLEERNGSEVREDQWREAVDQAYRALGRDETLAETLAAAQSGFEHGVLDNLRPYAASDRPWDELDLLFDTVEVLPAQKQSEYLRRFSISAIDASLLLVPIRKRQLASFSHLVGKLENAPKARNLPPVLDLPYDDRYGLRLS